jgi:glycine/D-amino acid oxidase-like deaminating enzyme
MAVRALELWQENEKRWKRPLFHRTGVLWLAATQDDYEKASLPLLREARVELDELSTADARKRFPQFNFEDVHWAIFEKNAGFLMARRNCQIVMENFQAEGGTYKQLAVTPGMVQGREMRPLALSDGSTFTADQYVFACGPWLGKVFPDEIGELLHPTRQEVFFFGVPAGDTRFVEPSMPTWIDHGASHYFYGIPGNEWRGFKMADDNRGPTFDPTNGDRTPSAAALKTVREHMNYRFPALKGAPLLEARVCQYENTPDENFIMDRHPHASNAWFLGGGSGHGYKHGPAVGEMMAQLVLGKKPVDPVFEFDRFKRGVEKGRVH